MFITCHFQIKIIEDLKVSNPCTNFPSVIPVFNQKFCVIFRLLKAVTQAEITAGSYIRYYSNSMIVLTSRPTFL